MRLTTKLLVKIGIPVMVGVGLVATTQQIIPSLRQRQVVSMNKEEVYNSQKQPIGARRIKQLKTPTDVQIFDLLPRNLQDVTFVPETCKTVSPEGIVTHEKAEIETDRIEKIRTDMNYDGIDEIIGVTNGVRGSNYSYLFSLSQDNGIWRESGDVKLPFDTTIYWNAKRPVLRIADARPIKKAILDYNENNEPKWLAINYPFTKN